MKIVVFGASGRIGERIINEGLSRGHQVTGVARDPSRCSISHPNFSAIKGDVTDPASVAAAAKGADAVVSAVSPTLSEGNLGMLSDAAHSLQEGLQAAGVTRLVVVGGAGSLQSAPGVMVMDSPQFPAEWRPIAEAHYYALKHYRDMDELDWTYISPADRIEAGTRTGKYRTDLEQLVRDESGVSHISMEDFAVALVDELEKPTHIKQRFTVGY